MYNDGIAVLGYFELCDFGAKGQGCIQSLTSNILAITWNFFNKSYIFIFLVKLSFKWCII